MFWAVLISAAYTLCTDSIKGNNPVQTPCGASWGSGNSVGTIIAGYNVWKGTLLQEEINSSSLT